MLMLKVNLSLELCKLISDKFRLLVKCFTFNLYFLTYLVYTYLYSVYSKTYTYIGGTTRTEMTNETPFHDEVEIEDFEFDEELQLYHYPCPCGDRFEITKESLEAGEDVAVCPSCSLIVRVIYEPEMFVKLETVCVDTIAKLQITA